MRTQITLVTGLFVLFVGLMAPACGSDENSGDASGSLGTDAGAAALDAAADVPVGMDAEAADVPAKSDGLDGGATGKGDGAVTDGAAAVGDATVAVLTDLSPQELAAALKNKDFLMIDVHYPYAGTIPGTDARIPFDDVPALVKFIGPDLDRKVVLTCLSSHMSVAAGQALVKLGYRHISQLQGGMMNWTDSGYSLDRDGGV